MVVECFDCNRFHCICIPEPPEPTYREITFDTLEDAMQFMAEGKHIRVSHPLVGDYRYGMSGKYIRPDYLSVIDMAIRNNWKIEEEIPA